MIAFRDILLIQGAIQIVHLKNSLRNVALGKAFVLQGGTLADLYGVITVG